MNMRLPIVENGEDVNEPEPEFQLRTYPLYPQGHARICSERNESVRRKGLAGDEKLGALLTPALPPLPTVFHKPGANMRSAFLNWRK